jgi:hypothetical protein
MPKLRPNRLEGTGPKAIIGLSILFINLLQEIFHCSYQDIISLHGLCRFEFPAGGYIHQKSISGLVDAKCMALCIDMRNHLMGMFDGIDFQIPHAAVKLFEFYDSQRSLQFPSKD